MLLKNIYGLKFPEEFLIKYFYKERLSDQRGKVLELGCGNGNNLSMFYQYGWDVTGVDIDKTSIENANNNFNALKKEYGIEENFSFIQGDMLSYVKKFEENFSFEALIFPNSLYYLDAKSINELFDIIMTKKMIVQGSSFFFKIRLDDDYRFGKGEQLHNKVFRLNIAETGEHGCIMTFFSKEEFLIFLNKYLEPKTLKVSEVSYHNFQNGKEIWNSELVTWGIL